MQAKQEERSGFDALVAETSSFFVNIPSDQLDNEIEGAQRRICEFLALDRSTLWQVLEHKSRTLLLTHVYHPSGSKPPPETMEAMEYFPWTAQKVLAGETVPIAKMSDLPPEADRDRETWGLFGTKSTIIIPLSVGGGPVFGALSFASMREARDWPETVVEGLVLISHVFANALARTRSDRALRENETALKNNEKDIRRLLSRLISTQEDELRRLSRELHDDLTQSLAALAIDTGNLEEELRNIAGLSPATLELLEHIKDRLIKVSNDVHTISREIHPSLLEDLGLVRTLESLCERISSREGLQITFDQVGDFSAVAKDIALCLYRVAQEGLRNITKHAHARSAEISLISDEGIIRLIISDKGIGFDSSDARQFPGLGLVSMRERVQLVGGEFSIESRLGQGTIIDISIPLEMTCPESLYHM